ncbi:hypothetical protein KR054_008328 [Drosophila jambulina]|nr:hypothetical protein KR054_008328 [Drosophila jambulina]
MLKKIQSKPKLHYEKVQRDEVQRDEIQFPLPEHTDPSICRDVFLKNIVKEHELRIGSLRLASEIDDRRMTTIDEVLQPPETADTLCVKDFLRHRQGQALRKTREEHIASIRLRCSMLIDLNRQSQMAAMNFVSVRLRKQLNVFANPWPGKLDDIPNNLFSWSLEDFIDRMSLKQTYLDEFIWELSQQDLDCLKFRRDMKEIQLITYQICQEFFDGDELCEGSFQYMR